MVKVSPTAKLFPPVNEVYQLMIPPLLVALKENTPGPHLTPVMEYVLMVGISVTVANTAVRVGVVQPLIVAST